jgi:adenylosuccinate lyase
MNENLNKTRGLYNSQRVLLKLIEKGLTRENAYRIVQNTAMISWEKGKEFFELLKNDEKVMEKISEEELHEIFDIKFHTRNIDSIFKKVLRK